LQKRPIVLRSLLIVATPYHLSLSRATPGLSCLIHIPYTRSQRGGGLGSSTIFKNSMSPTPRRKWYLTTGRRVNGTRPHPPTSPRTIFWVSTPAPHLSAHICCICRSIVFTYLSRRSILYSRTYAGHPHGSQNSQ